jgi:hypothetical protein
VGTVAEIGHPSLTMTALEQTSSLVGSLEQQ